MSTAIIRLTPGVRRVKAAEVENDGGFVAPVDEVVEVLGFRSMRVTLRIVNFEGVFYMQCMAVRRCTFAGLDARLFELGPPPTLLAPAQVPDSPPVAQWSNYGADLSCTTIDECEFRPEGRSTALAIRTSQAVPFRVRDCAFVGDADAMIVAWGATFLVERCSFANSRRPADRQPEVPGYETPDGVDIYLLYEAPREVGNTPVSLGVTRPASRFFGETLAAVTAIGCVSKSPTFFGTPTIPHGGLQYTSWPVLLLNVRHLPTDTSASAASIRWALRTNVPAVVALVRDRPNARLGSASALVVLGGQYGAVITALRALGQPAPIVAIGQRGLGDGLRGVDIPPPVIGAFRHSNLFGLKVDQGLP